MLTLEEIHTFTARADEAITRVEHPLRELPGDVLIHPVPFPHKGGYATRADWDAVFADLPDWVEPVYELQAEDVADVAIRDVLERDGVDGLRALLAGLRAADGGMDD